MQQWVITVLSSLVPALIVGILTAVISVRLALRRFHAERWWERKAEAYSQIVEALYHAMEYCSAHSDEALTGHQIGKERERILADGWNRAYRELKKTTSVGAYIISDEVAEVLAKLEERPRLDFKNCPSFEFFEDDYMAY
jgi:hypothetical protein